MNMTHLEVNLVQHNGMWMDKDAQEFMASLLDTADKLWKIVTEHGYTPQEWPMADRVQAIVDDKNRQVAQRNSVIEEKDGLINKLLITIEDLGKNIQAKEVAIFKYRAAIEQLTGIPESVKLVPELQAAVDKAGIKVDTNRAPGTIRPWTKPTVHRGPIDLD